MKLIDEFDISDRIKLRLQVRDFRGNERVREYQRRYWLKRALSEN